jgi:16S rRNA (cytosine967-C5)-methyltransferase
VAHQILEEVADGAYASDSLLEQSRRLTSRDAGLASQIVFGSLRFFGQLDFLIQKYSRRAPDSLDLPVLVALRAAIFQLRYLDRIPAHAAVHDAVEYVKNRQRAAAGLVNAVLRKVDRAPVAWPDESVELSCPAWLLDRWSGHFGKTSARSIAQAALEEPEAYIRVAPEQAPPKDFELEPTGVPGCFHVLSSPTAGSPGEIRQHDIGSQSVVPLLDLQPGQTYLDLCAAPGNKTLQALEVPLQLAVACDVSERRIRDIPPVCPRVVLDAARPLPFARKFDRIFIDAPCSGTGTLSRNPEIKWRVQAPDFIRFHQKQVQILRQAVAALHPDGKLLYATCSLEAEENEDVISAVLQSVQGLQLVAERWRLPGRDPGDGFYTAELRFAGSPRLSA